MVKETKLHEAFRRLVEESNRQAFMGVLHNRPVRLCNAKCNHPKGMRGEGLNDKLWIMEGSPSLDTFEAYVGEGFRNLAEGSKAGLQKVGIFSYIMKVLHEVHHFEYIIVDLNPSSVSSINKAAILSCDYVLPPVTAEVESITACVKMLSKLFPGPQGWLGFHQRYTNTWRGDRSGELSEEDQEWLLPRTPPAVLPFLVNMYGKELSAPPPSQSRSGSRGEQVMTLVKAENVISMVDYIERCPHIEGANSTVSGPKVKLVRWGGQAVINFMPFLSIANSVMTHCGRPAAELMDSAYCLKMMRDFFPHLQDMHEEATDQAKKRSKLASSLVEQNTAMEKTYHSEIFLAANRFLLLAKWIHWRAGKDGGGGAASGS